MLRGLPADDRARLHPEPAIAVEVPLAGSRTGVAVPHHLRGIHAGESRTRRPADRRCRGSASSSFTRPIPSTLVKFADCRAGQLAAASVPGSGQAAGEDQPTCRSPACAAPSPALPGHAPGPARSPGCRARASARFSAVSRWRCWRGVPLLVVDDRGSRPFAVVSMTPMRTIAITRCRAVLPAQVVAVAPGSGLRSGSARRAASSARRRGSGRRDRRRRARSCAWLPGSRRRWGTCASA